MKNRPANAGATSDPGSIPGSGRAPGEGNGNPLQDSGLEDSTDCIVHGVAKSRTRLSAFHSQPLQCSCLKNSMDRGAWQATFVEGHSAPAGWREQWERALPHPSGRAL